MRACRPTQRHFLARLAKFLAWVHARSDLLLPFGRSNGCTEPLRFQRARRRHRPSRRDLRIDLVAFPGAMRFSPDRTSGAWVTKGRIRSSVSARVELRRPRSRSRSGSPSRIGLARFEVQARTFDARPDVGCSSGSSSRNASPWTAPLGLRIGTRSAGSRRSASADIVPGQSRAVDRASTPKSRLDPRA